MPHRNYKMQGLGRALAMAALLAAVAAATACGDDSNPFPPTDCCIGNVHYICNDAGSASACLADPPNKADCVFQTTPCPVPATPASQARP